jgi:hypothetical protein
MEQTVIILLAEGWLPSKTVTILAARGRCRRGGTMAGAKLWAIMMASAATLLVQQSPLAARVYRVEDYGIELRAPPERIVCVNGSWEHVHGYGYNISPPLNCENNTDHTRASLVGIHADFNTAEWTFSEFARITCQGRNASLPNALFAGLDFYSRRTLHCAVEDKGEISIYAMAEGGHAADTHKSCVQYDAYLVTRRERIKKDLPLFKDFLRRVTIKPVTCD